MAAPASLPEFKGRVVAVETGPYWPLDLAAVDGKINQFKKQADRERAAKMKEDPSIKDSDLNRWRQERVNELTKEGLTDEELRLKEGISHWSLHYFGSAKCIGQMGQAFAKGLLTIE